jgi:hypothetical protein
VVEDDAVTLDTPITTAFAVAFPPEPPYPFGVPKGVFAIGTEDSNDMSVQRLHDPNARHHRELVRTSSESSNLAIVSGGAPPTWVALFPNAD